jgi:L-alanine-DL-glutamate epimerase-like enolase superfamily enzyme
VTRTRLRLFGAMLHYEPGIQVFTAISGPIPGLSELYLEIERDDGFVGIGEVRANVEYLTHIPEAAVAPLIRRVAERLDWSSPPDALLERLPAASAETPAIARAAVESALVEGIARRDGVPVAQVLGGAWQARTASCNCLFWSPDEVFERLAQRFVDDGFREIKVRIAIEGFDRDLARLGWLRDRFGSRIKLAVDANGAWTADVAIVRLRALERFELAYVEQPTTVGDWAAFEAVGRRSAIPLMLDEGLQSEADVARLCRLGPPYLAHLKIAKLGGPRAVVAAARRFADAGVAVMMGQMNEGAMATALAAHCAMAIGPRHAELYGAYGLVDDATRGLAYRGGAVALERLPGLGVGFDPTRATLIWEFDRREAA